MPHKPSYLELDESGCAVVDVEPAGAADQSSSTPVTLVDACTYSHCRKGWSQKKSRFLSAVQVRRQVRQTVDSYWSHMCRRTRRNVTYIFGVPSLFHFRVVNSYLSQIFMGNMIGSFSPTTTTTTASPSVLFYALSLPNLAAVQFH